MRSIVGVQMSRKTNVLRRRGDASLYRTERDEIGNPLADARDQDIALFQVQPDRGDRLADANADRHRPDDPAAPPHRRASPLDRDGDDGRAGFYGHDEAAPLARQ